MMQIPHGPKNLKCPFWHKPMSQVCHTCPCWVLVRGKDPQSTQEVDRWDCAVAWLPMLLIENAQQSRQAGASADKVATEVNKFHRNMAEFNKLSIALQAGGSNGSLAVEDKRGG